MSNSLLPSHIYHESSRLLEKTLSIPWFSPFWNISMVDLPTNMRRGRKTLRGGHGEIPYANLSYGKIIGTCTQEVLNLCNELKMARQLKMDKLRETSQLGDLCEQFGLSNLIAKSSNPDKYYKFSRTEGSHRKRKSRRRSKEDCEARKSSRKSNRFTKDRSGRDLSKIKCYKCGKLGHISPNCRLNKLKVLELDEETYEMVYGMLYTSDSDDDYESGLGSNITLFDSSDNDNNHANPCDTFQGQDCHCEDDEIYKLQSQFQDFNMNTITSDNNDSNDFEYSAPYSLKEVDDRLLKRNTSPEKDSSFNDLKIEVENLKRGIKSLKQNQSICDHRITQIEINNSEERFSKNKGKQVDIEPVDPNPKQDMFLGMMQIVTAHKWYVKCTILIDNNFAITNIDMIDTSADVSCIQEGLVPTKYFQKTTHLVKFASGHALDIKYKLPNAKICQNKVCIPRFFFLVKNQLNPPIILGTPFINAIYPFIGIDSKGFSATYK
ncbi:hypothetical protein H5410_015705 [Solanum commersonii]|uniref:CCHC-type domain-containing protein n=1 Tax=Solanum commersonii TaxID=4109 RepID=A0A9J5ZUH1_SOLCO|nr:hypothetical protein H5410_015705 [Solanum commersonii]